MVVLAVDAVDERAVAVVGLLLLLLRGARVEVVGRAERGRCGLVEVVGRAEVLRDLLVAGAVAGGRRLVVGGELLRLGQRGRLLLLVGGLLVEGRLLLVRRLVRCLERRLLGRLVGGLLRREVGRLLRGLILGLLDGRGRGLGA